MSMSHPWQAPGRRRALALGAAALILLGILAVVGRRAVPPTAAARLGADALGVLDRVGLTAALDTLERLAAADSAVLRDAHQLAHALGRRALVASGGDPSVLSQCRPVFGSGCYHGVIEAYLDDRGRIDMQELEAMCTAAGTEDRPGTVYECVHGLGHGVLGVVRLDAPAALRHCDALSTPRFRSSCHEGVFMEAITSAVGPPGAAGGHTRAGASHAGHDGSPAGRLVLDPRDPYAPCDAFSGRYAESCWLLQGFVILRAVGFDAKRALQTCEAAPDGRARRCYESVGHQLTGLSQRGDEWIVRQCAQGTPELASHCAAGAALALAGMDWSGARAVRFCTAAPGAWKEACYRAAAGLLGAVASRAQRAGVCASLDPTLRGACRRTAGLEEAPELKGNES